MKGSPILNDYWWGRKGKTGTAVKTPKIEMRECEQKVMDAPDFAAKEYKIRT